MPAHEAGLFLDLGSVIGDLTRLAQRQDKAVDKAIDRANRKLMTWLKGRIAKAIAQDAGMVQRAIRTRFRVSLNKRQRTGTLWLGLNPVEAQALGDPRQTGSGVKAGKHFFEGAFVAEIYQPIRKVWRRKRRGVGSSALSPFAVGDARRGRFPVEKQAVEIEEAGREIVRRLQARAMTRYRELLAQELNYAMNHER